MFFSIKQLSSKKIHPLAHLPGTLIRAFRGGRGAAVSIALLFSATCQAGEVVAKFAGGEGENAPDEFPGCAGGGWSGGWIIKPKLNNDFSAEVAANTDFPDSGKTLKLSRLNGSAFITLSRLLESNPVDTSKPHTISFDIQAGEYSGEADFRFTISGSAASMSGGWESGASQAATPIWTIVAQRNGWVAFSSEGNGKLKFKALGMKFAIGPVYSVQISVNPESRSYTVVISSGAASATSSELMFQTEGTALATNQLSFIGWVQDGAEGPFAWSLANIAIKQTL